MSATQIATVHIEGLHNQAAAGAETIGTIAFYKLDGSAWSTGHVSPNLKTLRLRHTSDVKKIRGQRGLTTGLLANDEMLECTFDFIMEGTSRANALASSLLPEILTPVLIANLPVINVGYGVVAQAKGFADALNATVGSNTFPWIYEGDGSINGESEDVWSGSVTLRRYKGIPTWSFTS